MVDDGIYFLIDLLKYRHTVGAYQLSWYDFFNPCTNHPSKRLGSNSQDDMRCLYNPYFSVNTMRIAHNTIQITPIWVNVYSTSPRFWCNFLQIPVNTMGKFGIVS